MGIDSGLLIGWTRPVPGREAEAQSKFGEFGGYLGKLQSQKTIDSFEPVIVAPHGGDLGGFFLVRGEGAKLAELRQTVEWKDWMAWADFHLAGFGAVECHVGAGVQDTMARFGKFVR